MARSTEASSVTSISTICKASRSRCARARSASAAGAFLPAAARMPANTRYPWRARVSTVRRPKPLVLPVTRIVCSILTHPFFHALGTLGRCLLRSNQGFDGLWMYCELSHLSSFLVGGSAQLMAVSCARDALAQFTAQEAAQAVTAACAAV